VAAAAQQLLQASFRQRMPQMVAAQFESLLHVAVLSDSKSVKVELLLHQ
jgi:hypothetical protein